MWTATNAAVIWRVSQQHLASVLQEHPDAALQLFQRAFQSSKAVSSLQVSCNLLAAALVLAWLSLLIHHEVYNSEFACRDFVATDPQMLQQTL